MQSVESHNISTVFLFPLLTYCQCTQLIFPLSSDLFPHTVPPVFVCVCVWFWWGGLKEPDLSCSSSCLHILYSLCKKFLHFITEQLCLCALTFTPLPWYSIQWNLYSLFLHRPWKENNKCGKWHFWDSIKIPETQEDNNMIIINFPHKPTKILTSIVVIPACKSLFPNKL